MKHTKHWLFTAVMMLAVTLAAYHPTETAAELKGVKWVSGTPVSVAPVEAKSASGVATPELRVITFMICRSPLAANTAVKLAQMQRFYGNRVKFAVVTPDPEEDAGRIAEMMGKLSSSLAIGVDEKRELTSNYMAGSNLFPGSFIINRQGIILWRGETADCTGAIDRGLKGELDAGNQLQIAKYTEELRLAMRGNEERKQRQYAEAIFKLEPDNAGALRMRMFYLENTGKRDQAKALLFERLKAAPQSANLYFSAVSFASRAGMTAEELRELLEIFTKNITEQKHRSAMAWLLMETFQSNADMLEMTSKLLPERTATDGNTLLLLARYAGCLGQFDRAIEFSTRAEAAFEQSYAPDYVIANVKQLTRYYRTAKKLSER